MLPPVVSLSRTVRKQRCSVDSHTPMHARRQLTTLAPRCPRGDSFFVSAGGAAHGCGSRSIADLVDARIATHAITKIVGGPTAPTRKSGRGGGQSAFGPIGGILDGEPHYRHCRGSGVLRIAGSFFAVVGKHFLIDHRTRLGGDCSSEGPAVDSIFGAAAGTEERRALACTLVEEEFFGRR